MVKLLKYFSYSCITLLFAVSILLPIKTTKAVFAPVWFQIVIDSPAGGETISGTQAVTGRTNYMPQSLAVSYNVSGGWRLACQPANATSWSCNWNTTSVANGTYSVRAQGLYGGDIYYSKTIILTINNQTTAPPGGGGTPTPSGGSSSNPGGGGTTTKTPTSGNRGSITPQASASSQSTGLTSNSTSSNSNASKTKIGAYRFLNDNSYWFSIFLLILLILLLIFLVILRRRREKKEKEKKAHENHGQSPPKIESK